MNCPLQAGEDPELWKAREDDNTRSVVESHPLYDWLVAGWQSTPWSARKTEPFVRKHNIDVSEFEPGPYRSYAAFLTGASGRASVASPLSRARWAPLARRYFGWRALDLNKTFPVKGVALEAKNITWRRCTSIGVQGRAPHSRASLADGLPP
jgi:phosphatidylserine decarboxylase